MKRIELHETLTFLEGTAVTGMDLVIWVGIGIVVFAIMGALAEVYVWAKSISRKISHLKVSRNRFEDLRFERRVRH